MDVGEMIQLNCKEDDFIKPFFQIILADAKINCKF